MSGADTLFLVVILSMACTIVFSTAPGLVTLNIGIPEWIDNCNSEECQYNLEFCIGSGRLLDEQCSWLPRQNYSGQYFQGQNLLVKKSFEVDNIKSSFYFNANFSFYAANKFTKMIRFKNNMFQYSSYNTTHSMSLHSENYESMQMEMTVKCKSGYYPQFQCIRSCFPVQGVYGCDFNGVKICFEGYTLLVSTGECIQDTCKLKSDICLNNSTCENDLPSIRCVCQPDYYGTACELWLPCKEHKCQNSGICIERRTQKNYMCQCRENYYGNYCEHYEDPCKHKQCPPGFLCQRNENVASCEESFTDKTNDDRMRWFSTRKSKTALTNPTTRMNVAIVVDGESKGRENVKHFQYPVQKDYTTIGIIIVLLIFMICCFIIIFWIQMNKYFHRRQKSSIRLELPEMPSVIPMRTQAAFEDTIKRWRSLDDGFANIWQHHNCSQFSVMSCKSGFNSCQRPSSHGDNYRNIYENWPTTNTRRVSTRNESCGPGPPETGGFLNESTQTNLDKIGDCEPEIDYNDLPMPEDVSN